MESKTFFYFVIGDTACDFNIGFIQYSDSFNAHCIITQYFYPDVFKKILSLPEDQQLFHVKSLSQELSRKTVEINDHTFELDGGYERQCLMKFVFDNFSVFDITKIIISMLQSRHIFVVSSSASNCCKLCVALPLLIEPFRWDLNTIPILPIKLKEASQIPVPTIIGITNAEVLLEGRLDSHLIVNFDIKLSIDKPPLDSTSPHYQKIISLQMNCQYTLQSYLRSWEGSPGFPNRSVSRILRKFIASYLMIYSNAKSSDDLIAAVDNFPDYLAMSQVIQDLQNLDHIPKNVSDALKKWFEEVFERKVTTITAKRAPQGSVITRAQSQGTLGTKAKKEEPMLIDFGEDVKQKPKEDDLLDLMSFDTPTPVRSQSQQLIQAQQTPSPKRDELFDLFDQQQISPNPSVKDAQKSDDLLRFFSDEDFAVSTPQKSQSSQQPSNDFIDFLDGVGLSPTPSASVSPKNNSTNASNNDSLIWFD
ncbi:DENN domain-containing protein 1A [Histomonas meleagridis]|uniref:DENN domain-containing protein 1A n=1 Tax=Histomonas meleagridis TaxID=135588 RepID=UPI003559B827|nr:DENN domain-containing protein 1A [Histomonas meleagridis]KAH0804776.1 DENN domain-containing protein 1A [Histomonas meleagridis]